MKDEERARETLNLAFIKLLDNLAKYDETKSFDGWVSRIMVTTSIDELRKDKRHQSEEIEDYINYQNSNETY